jgi:hypothetical protein
MTTQTEFIEVARRQSVQTKPDVKKGQIARPFLFGSTWRGPLLDAHGMRLREWQLRRYFRHDYNTIFPSAIAGLVKRLQSMPWKISGSNDENPQIAEWVAFYQDVLWNADFGAGWESFLSKLVEDYSVLDGGAYVECIGPGNPNEPMVSNGVTGLSVLDGLRCEPTDDPDYPVIYMDALGKMHVIPITRVVRMVDTPDSDVMSYGYGQSALSRCIATVQREILMNRYVEQQLDDNPPPGLMLFKNISDAALEEAFMKLEKERSTDQGAKWGNVVKLFGSMAEVNPEVQVIAYANPPEKFDYIEYKNLAVKEIALAVGLDIQDLWELQGRGIGTATQSEVLHEKSKGRAIGRLVKSIERLINQALPEELEFEFEYIDTSEEEKRAAIAQMWATTVSTIAPLIGDQATQQLLADVIEPVRKVLTDESGKLIVLGDVDPETPQQAQPDEITATDATEVVDQPQAPMQKALADTEASFRNDFIHLVGLVQEGSLSPTTVRPALRLALVEAGSSVWLDGLRDAGVENPILDDAARQAIAIWRSQQNTYLDNFVDEIFSKEMTPESIRSRADMWVNKSVNRLYFQAKAAAAPRQRYMWVVDPIKEHCRTCLALNGQIHEMKYFAERNLLPQSDALVCGGYHCGCRLVPTDQPSRGRLRAVPYRRKEHHAVLH